MRLKKACIGWDELQQAKYALRTLPKGLQFFRVVSPSKSPNVMGLTGIHDPNELCCFNGLTHYPWCGKEGQNEGTIISHLWTVHYMFGSCVRNVLAAHPSCRKPSTTMARRTANPQRREVPISHPHQHNHWHKMC